MQTLELINRAKSNDKVAFKGLVRLYSKWLLGLIKSLTTASEAEDIAQEVWVIVWKNVRSLKDISKFKGWVRTIAVRQSIAYHKKLKILKDIVEIKNDIHASEANQYRLLETREQVEGFLKKLSFDQKTTFVLFELEGMSLKEISETLNIPEGTVKSRLSKIRALYMRILASENESSCNEVCHVKT